MTADDLAKIVGEAHAREGGAADAVDGVAPALVVAPGSVGEAAEVLAATARSGARVVFRGGGSKLGWGNPPRGLDLLVSTARLDQVLEHAAGDLVVRAQAGVRLADLQRSLAPAGQLLALDPPEPGATLGGVVAAAASGPRRLRYGTPRDLLIGITVVLADGTVAKAGGKVVKNVAGYDLGKLFAGSFGTLGLIAETTFRLHPLPAAARAVTVGVDTPERAGACVQALLHSTLVPSALELDWPSADGPGTLAVLFEGIEPGVEAQAAVAAGLLGDHAEAAGELPPWPAWPEERMVVKVASVPTALPEVVDALRRAGAAPLRAHAGTAVVHAALDAADPDAAVRTVTDLRERLGRIGASVLVRSAPPPVKERLDAWGPAGDAVALMRAVKRQFDPADALAPGRFVASI